MAKPVCLRHNRELLQVSEFFTSSEVAKILKISPDSVIRKFETRPGVIDLGRPETTHKRRYKILRIPREAVEKFVIESRVA